MGLTQFECRATVIRMFVDSILNGRYAQVGDDGCGSEAEVDSSIQRMHHCENVLLGIAEMEGNTERASVSLTLASEADWRVSHAAPAAPDRLRLHSTLRGSSGAPRRSAGRGGPAHSNA